MDFSLSWWPFCLCVVYIAEQEGSDFHFHLHLWCYYCWEHSWQAWEPFSLGLWGIQDSPVLRKEKRKESGSCIILNSHQLGQQGV